VAIEWGVIDHMPCTIKLLKTVPPEMGFYEAEAYGRLVEAARKIGPQEHLMVLLGGQAGLRRGEMISLRLTDVDPVRRLLLVQRATWQGVEDLPKGGRPRRVPLTKELFAALTANRHLCGDRVLRQPNGKPVDENILQDWIEAATRRAGLPVTRGLHILRHTFCSLLAIRGAPVNAIKELAGHADIGTTMRYMHLSPSQLDGAIHLLDQPADGGQTESPGRASPTSLVSAAS
jgi:integrase